MKKLIVPILLLFLAGCATSPTGRSQLMLVSPEQAIVASQKAYSQTITSLAREGKVNPDPAIAEARDMLLAEGMKTNYLMWYMIASTI